MMSKPSFEIIRCDRCINIKLSGVWNSSVDLEYLSELGRVMQQMRQSTWVIIADLRDWHIEEDTAQRNTRYSLHLDRRNQIGECWLVRNQLQAQHLDPFFAELEFTPQRVLNQTELDAWCKPLNIHLPSSIIQKLYTPA